MGCEEFGAPGGGEQGEVGLGMRRTGKETESAELENSHENRLSRVAKGQWTNAPAGVGSEILDNKNVRYPFEFLKLFLQCNSPWYLLVLSKSFNRTRNLTRLFSL